MKRREGLTSKELASISRQIKKSVEADRIFLFGSYSRGSTDDFSDIDLCVVTRSKDRRKIDLMRAIRKNLREVTSLPLDILVYYTDEFKERSSNPSTLESSILRNGTEIG